MSRSVRTAILLASLAALVPAAAVDAAPDVVIVLEEGEAPKWSGPVTLVESVPGERYAWNLTLEGAYAIAEIDVRGAFDVARPKQVVPEYDDRAQHPAADHLHPHFFAEVRGSVADVDGPARVFNVTEGGSGDRFVLHLGLPGPGSAQLVLRRDVAPPGFEVDAPVNVTERSFLLRTRTDEFAYGDAVLRPARGGGDVRNPTPTPSLEQTFPIIGLAADTEYVVRVAFTDWSGNRADAPEFRVRTLPEPVRPRATITPLEPEPNATLDAPVTTIRARVDSSASPIPEGGVRLFVDKSEVHDAFRFADGVLVYEPPQPLGPGKHSASVEATNEAGG
ncbi:MAG TPA: hypothetical protein VI997_09830, partial [Candidatus Thermoplasmatota archaeon]|nr:hypothetical protein [Candidatus Thermoplasmatota archaeon]